MSEATDAPPPAVASSAKMSGVLDMAHIRDLVSAGAIVRADDAARVQPSSLDLTLGARAFRVRASFLPGRGRSVDARLDDEIVMHEIDLRGGAVLERGCVYLVPLQEALRLPGNVSAVANPKSSTGRIDVFTRLVADRAEAFDWVPAGYAGPLYAEISPRTFSVVVREGSTLNQIRFRQGDARLTDAELSAVHAAEPLASESAVISEGLVMSAGLAPLGGAAGEIVGYRARRHSALIDVDAVGGLDPAAYWEPISAPRNGRIILDPDEFYILASKEWLRVPADMAAEMTAIDPRLGEFRVHYAGFFDPGFGCAEAGGAGARAVLEVRSREAPFLLEDGQPVARLVYERLVGRPDALYGAGLSSNYQGQGLKLSKHFRDWNVAAAGK